MAVVDPTDGGKRLGSWKEIAAFFGRDERTLNRWEKEQGLPVHRWPGTKGRVYAFTDELSAWLAAPRSSSAAGPVPDSSAGLPVAVSGMTVSPQQPIAADSKSRELPAESGGKVREDYPRYRQLAIRFTVVAVLGLGVLALVVFPPGANRSPNPSDHAMAPPRQASPGNAVLASTPAHDPEAEQLYLRGRYYWNKRTPEDLSKALDYFTQAVVHDPNYAQAYVGLADCYNLMREYTLMPSSEAYPRALAAAKKAVDLDDQ